jgi:phenylacetic acid degradation protein paaN
MASLFCTHQQRLEKAIDACANRYAWTGFVESPSSRIHGKEIPAAAELAFEEMLEQRFALDIPATDGWIGDETSPFSNRKLGIQYPKIDVDNTFSAANVAVKGWRRSTVQERVGVCMEILEQLSAPAELFLNAHATMHTAGQSFIMAYAGCGANSLDRGLEAIAYAYKAMADVPATAQWERRFGTGEPAALQKQFRLMPRGVGIVITCATFPQWNGYPAILANLATGNASVVKPHPNCVLPVALFVRTMRRVLKEAGVDPNLVTMAVDTRDEPVTLALINHPATKIIDFTGGPNFGRWIEENCRNALTFTETAGCNSVILESVDALDDVCNAIAHSLCQASAQMCTSVQNIFIPADGILVAGELVSAKVVREALVAAVDSQVTNSKQVANLCGALVDPAVQDRIDRMREIGTDVGRIVRDSSAYVHNDYPKANTATPLIIELDVTHKDIYGQEHFGPISFIILAKDRKQALQRATEDARDHGAITSHVYSTDREFLELAQESYCDAGASMACNLTGMPINFAAAYSDYHVTGMNPAGTACLTDLAFVAGRFRITQIKSPLESG